MTPMTAKGIEPMAARVAYCIGKSMNDAKQKSAKMRKLTHQRERKRMAKREFSAILYFMFAFCTSFDFSI
ncbi:MAG: hypothetical protein IPI14_12595 [Polaromonas sp.]|nr:hypothetical protein [Polaromonas sp.]